METEIANIKMSNSKISFGALRIDSEASTYDVGNSAKQKFNGFRWKFLHVQGAKQQGDQISIRRKGGFQFPEKSTKELRNCSLDSTF